MTDDEYERFQNDYLRHYEAYKAEHPGVEWENLTRPELIAISDTVVARVRAEYTEYQEAERRAFDLMFDAALVNGSSPPELRQTAEQALYELSPSWFLEAWQIRFHDSPLPSRIAERHQQALRELAVASDPQGWMAKELEQLTAIEKEIARQAEQERANRDGRILVQPLPHGAQLPHHVAVEDANASVRSWITGTGVLRDGKWYSPLPDGRMASWDPTTNAPVRIEGTPDRVSLALRQWVEEPFGEEPAAFREKVLGPNPRWRRTVAKLRQSREPLSRADVEAALRLDSLPHTPSVVSYALSVLGLGEFVEPCRGGMVTTFVVDTVYDDERPDWKDRYHVPPIVVEASLETPVAEALANVLRESLARRQDDLSKHTYEVLQTIAASETWTTDEIWRRAFRCRADHVRWIASGHVAGINIGEGNLRPGVKPEDDEINKAIERAIASGRIRSMKDREEVRLLIQEITMAEVKRRKDKRLAPISDFDGFRRSVRERVRRALNRT